MALSDIELADIYTDAAVKHYHDNRPVDAQTAALIASVYLRRATLTDQPAGTREITEAIR